MTPYSGPYGSTVTLPRQLPADFRVFSTDRKHPTKRAAHRRVAFKAYLALYHAGLLNDNLLPWTSVIEPDLEEEVQALLKDVEKRAGTASVTCQMNPWAPIQGSNTWWCTQLAIEGLPALYMITRTQLPNFTEDEYVTLYHPHRHPAKVGIHVTDTINPSMEMLEKAKIYTRRIFWEFYGSRMTWEDLNFAYLFLPAGDVEESYEWTRRRSWLDDLDEATSPEAVPHANAAVFGKQFLFPNDLTIIREHGQKYKNYRFLRWRFDVLSPDEEQALRNRYSFDIGDTIKPPFLVAQRFPRRMNFLIPFVSQKGKHSTEMELIFRPEFSTVSFLSANDVDYALLLPSIIRHLSTAMTISSLRENILTPSLARISFKLLITAITAPVSGAPFDYQRLEILGDTVLKFTVGLQLLAEYPHWHEGYLTKKKDHAVSNASLAREALGKGLYRWIIRDRFLAQKWKPEYLSSTVEELHLSQGSADTEEKEQSTKESQQLSTKILADVGA